MKKRILSIILSVIMIVGMLPMATLHAFADTETLRDILYKVAGTYGVSTGEDTEEFFSTTATINEDEFVIEQIHFDLAFRSILDKTGLKIWMTQTVVDGQPVFGLEPDDMSEGETLDTILDLEIAIMTDEKILSDGSVIPVGSYVVNGMNFTFFDEQNGKTQKMYSDGSKVLNRIGDGVHKHTFSNAWNYSDTHHWHYATCGHSEIVSGFGSHNLTEKTNGNATTYTCACGYQKIVYNTAGDDEGEVVTGISYTGISLTLGSDISINFYMTLTDEERENGTMKFDIGGRTVTLNGTDAKYNETEEKYYFSMPITALEMAETVTATFSCNAVNYIQEYSVKDYIEEIVGNSDEYGDKAVMLARKIANYGYYAQRYLASIHTNVRIVDSGDGYDRMIHFDNTETEDIDVEAAKTALNDFGVTVTGASESLSLFGTSVYFDSATALNYYVKATGGTLPTATAVNPVTEKNKTVEIKHYKDDIYIVSVKDIIATELADNIAVTVNGGLTITGSVLAYCNSVIKAHSFDGATDIDTFAVNAMAAFYEYYVAACEYDESLKTVYYDVTFDMDHRCENITVKVKKDEKVSRPNPDPRSSGFVFDGWYADSGYNTPWNFDTFVITDNTTIYIKWFDIQVAKTEIAEAAEVAKNVIDSLEWLADDKKADYKKNIDDEATTAKEVVENAESKAKVDAALQNVKVKMDMIKEAAKDKDAEEEDDYKCAEKSDVNSYASEKEADINEMSWIQAEYDVKADYLSRISSIADKAEDAIENASSKTYVAYAVDVAEVGIDAIVTEAESYIAGRHIVTFKMNGHGSDIPNQAVTDGGKVTKPADPTADDYNFDGWYADDEYKTLWDFDTDTVTTDITLYAKWNEIQYNAKYVVSLWDVNSNGVATFGPATGTEYSCLNHTCGSEHCIHNDSWSTIKANLVNNPDYYNDCIKDGCTKEIPLVLNDTIFSGTAALNPSSVLYNSIKADYHKYNDKSSSSGDSECVCWDTSKIRATLNGYNNDYSPFVPSANYAGLNCLSKDNCLLSCFPTELQDIITARTYNVATRWGNSSPYDAMTQTSVTDKLWLPSASEVYASLTNEYKDYGNVFLAKTDITDMSYSKNKAYNESKVSTNWWLRSPCRSYNNKVAYVNMTGSLNYDGNNTQMGLAPCFCI